MSQPTMISRQEIGAQVENFYLPTLMGQPVNLQQLLEGKRGAVVIFWSCVCSHCVHYDEYLNQFAARHPELALVAIASRQGESLEQIRAVAAERKLQFPILYDAGGEVALRWYTQQTPRAFLLDGQRVLRYRGAIDNFKYSGDREYLEYLEPAIRQLIAGETVTRTETASFGCAIQSVYYNLPKAL